ncbi:MAG TPA: AAA family ATPase [Gemmataceae bacterium]|nr:AAA family ATPase [Gemmataceae bacterium]
MELSAVGDLKSRPVSWLWPGRLARGKLAMLDGDPGLGKSLVTLDLCARLSRGQPFPDGPARSGPAASLVLNGEDSAEDTIRPRLQALGADLERVFVLHAGDGPGAEPLQLPEHTAVLDDALKQTHARLLVIDPIVSFLGVHIQSGNDASVRRALAPLAQLADRHGTAVLLVRHLNKSPGRSPIYRGGGSIGFLAACRSGWLIARDPEQPSHCALAQVKNNLAPPQPSLAYQVESAKSKVLSLSWLGPTDWTAAQLLAGVPRNPPQRLTPREQARDFLEGFLRDGPRTSRQIWHAALPLGLTERTLERAKQELSIRSVRVYADGDRISYWLLPGQELPESVKRFVLDLDYWRVGPLPGPTPLDKM